MFGSRLQLNISNHMRMCSSDQENTIGSSPSTKSDKLNVSKGQDETTHLPWNFDEKIKKLLISCPVS